MKPGRGNSSSPHQGTRGAKSPSPAGWGWGGGSTPATTRSQKPPLPTPALLDGEGGKPADQTRQTSPSSLSLPVSRARIPQKFEAPDAAKPRWRRGFGERMNGASEGVARWGRGAAWAEFGWSGACRKMELQCSQLGKGSSSSPSDNRSKSFEEWIRRKNWGG